MAGWVGLTLGNELLNLIYRGTSLSIGGTLYMRLLVAPSSRAGVGTETNFGGYARKAFPRDATIFTSAASAGQLTNGVVIEIALATSLGNGDLVWFDFVDTPSGAFSKLYHGGPITPARAIVVGKTVKFRVGALVLTI